MIEIVRNENCGNSPKNSFAQEMAIALSQSDTDFLSERLSENVHWRTVGVREIQGRQEVVNFVADKKDALLRKVIVHHVITHGKVGSVNGIRQFKDGSMEEFCDVYEFTNTKGNMVGVITSYVLR